jgi:Ribosomal RNA adenine dimethylase
MNDPRTFLEPLAGYMMDLWWRFRNRPFTPHSLTKLHNIRTAQVLSGAKTAIEIGTYKGVTAKRLARIFDRVVTVEIDPVLHEEARKRCAGFKNITFHLGDGSKLLPEIIRSENNILFFLDGHFSGTGTGHGDEPEPALMEIDIIGRHIDKISAVVVDDFRLFGFEPGWPTKSQLVSKLETTFDQKSWTIVPLNDQLLVYRRNQQVAK